MNIKDFKTFIRSKGFKYNPTFNTFTFKHLKDEYPVNDKGLSGFFNGIKKVELENGEKMTLHDFFRYLVDTQDSEFLVSNNIEKPSYNRYDKDSLVKSDELSVMCAHMDNLLGANNIRYIDFMSYVYNHIGNEEAQLPYALVILGSQGNGKTVLMNLFTKAFTDSNVGKINSFGDLRGFNYNLFGKSLVVMDDGYMPRGDMEVNAMKDFLTSNNIIIQKKYCDEVKTPNVGHLLINTNDDSFYIEKDDRRLKVLLTNDDVDRNNLNKFISLLKNKDYLDMLRFILDNLNTTTDFFSNDSDCDYKRKISLRNDNFVRHFNKIYNQFVEGMFNDDSVKIENGIMSMKSTWLASYMNFSRITPKDLNHLKIDGKPFVFLNRTKDALGNNYYKIQVSLTALDKLYDDDSFDEKQVSLKQYIIEHIDWDNLTPTNEDNGNNDSNEEDFGIDDILKDIESFKPEPIDNKVYNNLDSFLDELTDNDFEKDRQQTHDKVNTYAFNSIFETECVNNVDYDDYSDKSQFDILNDFKEGSELKRKNENFETNRFLFEMDETPIKEQYKLMKELINEKKVPIRRATFSGNKSIHMIIEFPKDNAPTNKDEYKFVWKLINRFYFNDLADKACCNNARLTRRPNGINEKTNKEQSLIYHSNIQFNIKNWRTLYDSFITNKKIDKVYKPMDINDFNISILEDIAKNDERFNIVFNHLPYKYWQGKRNELKVYSVNLMKKQGTPSQLIYEIEERWMGDLYGENSIDSLMTDYHN